MQQSTYSAEGNYLTIISGMGCRATMFKIRWHYQFRRFLDVRVDDFDFDSVASACTTRLAIQRSCACMPYRSIYFMYYFQHFQRPLTADIETLARTTSIIVEGRLPYLHDRTVLRQDKQLRDNELVVEQSNLAWDTYVQYNQCSFHSHY